MGRTGSYTVCPAVPSSRYPPVPLVCTRLVANVDHFVWNPKRDADDDEDNRSLARSFVRSLLEKERSSTNCEWNSIRKAKQKKSKFNNAELLWLPFHAQFSVQNRSQHWDQGKCRLVWHDRWSVAESPSSHPSVWPRLFWGFLVPAADVFLVALFSLRFSFSFSFSFSFFMPQRTIYTLKHFNFYCIARSLPFFSPSIHPSNQPSIQPSIHLILINSAAR